MKFSHIGWVALAGFAMVAPAHALTITNNETSEQRIVIIQGDSEQEQKLAPGESRDGLCTNSCILRLPSGDEYDLEPQDVVLIEDGSLFIDAPVQGDANPPAQEKPVSQ